MIVTVLPSKATGNIQAPPSKSLAHRYIICAALAKGISVISNIDYSEDILATIDCIKELGAKVEIVGSTVTVDGIDGICNKKELNFKCRESGSTMRFFMGIAMYFGIPSNFYGSATLRNRPFSIYEELCKEDNIVFEKKDDCIFINGKLSKRIFEIAGNISSQFITGLLFALPLMAYDTKIRLIPPVESRSYLNLTLQSLRLFGIALSFDNDTFSVKGNQKFIPTDVSVEGDCSNAAFLDAFNYCGGNVCVDSINPHTLQGDRVYHEYFEKLKAEKAHIDISDCPDLGPVLFAVAALNNGGVFTGTKRLKMKESDRGTVMCEELMKFGVSSFIEDNSIVIDKCDLTEPNEILSGHNDHRIVMSLVLLMTIFGGSIDQAEAVKKSYPGFFDDIMKLGIEVRKEG